MDKSDAKNRASIGVFDVNTKKIIREFNAPSNLEYCHLKLSFENPNTLVGISRNRIVKWDFETGKVIINKKFNAATYYWTYDFDTQNGVAALSGWDGAMGMSYHHLTIWNMKTGNSIFVPQVANGFENTNAVATVPKTKLIILANLCGKGHSFCRGPGLDGYNYDGTEITNFLPAVNSIINKIPADWSRSSMALKYLEEKKLLIFSTWGRIFFIDLEKDKILSHYDFSQDGVYSNPAILVDSQNGYIALKMGSNQNASISYFKF